MMPEAEYRKMVSEYADFVRSARPIKEGAEVRMPFQRSFQERKRRKEMHTIDVAELVYDKLRQAAGRN